MNFLTVATLTNLQEVQNAVKEDPVLNKKVLEAAKAYTKNSTILTKLLTLVKSFYFFGFKASVDSLQAAMNAQNDHLDKWVESSAFMAWSIGPRMTRIESTQATIQSDITSLRTYTTDIKAMMIEILEPTQTKGEKYDINTKVKMSKDVDVEKETEQEPDTKPILITIVMPTTKPTLEVELIGSSSQPSDVVINITPPYKASLESNLKFSIQLQSLIEERVHMEIEERKEKAAQEARLLALSKPELIKFVTEVANEVGVDPKVLQSSKGGKEFIKKQDAEMKVLNREHAKSSRKQKSSERKGFINIDGLPLADVSLKQSLIFSSIQTQNLLQSQSTKAMIEGTLRFTTLSGLVTLA
ncbi:hypothetical protein Tco_1071845 [Tanacetum coccineum]